MKKVFSLLLCVILAVGCFAGCTAKPAQKSLNIMTYAGWIPDVSVKAFEKAFSVKVNFTAADSDETMLSKLQAANGGSYDIVLADDYIIPSFVSSNIVTKLDWTKIENKKNIDPRYQSQFYDKNNEYTVPYAAGYTFIVYNSKTTPFTTKTYDDLWNMSLQNALVVPDNGRVLTGITLLTQGKSMNTTNAGELSAAKEKLLKLRKNVKLFNSDTPHEALINGDAKAGLMASSQAAAALRASADLKAVYPTDGLGYGIGAIMVPSKAPNMDMAYEFLNFILDGKNAAQASEAIDYICCNTAAEEFLSESYKNNPAVFPPKEALDKVKPEMVQSVDDKTAAAFDDIYTAFKNAK